MNLILARKQINTKILSKTKLMIQLHSVEEKTLETNNTNLFRCVLLYYIYIYEKEKHIEVFPPFLLYSIYN